MKSPWLHCPGEEPLATLFGSRDLGYTVQVKSLWLRCSGEESMFTLMWGLWCVWWFVSCGGRSNMGESLCQESV